MQETVTVASSGGSITDVRMVREDFVARTEILATPEAVWASVPDVFREVGLPAPKLDQAQHIALVENHAVSRVLGKEPLSKYLSCGSGISGEYADTHRIRLTVRTMVQRTGERKTEVQTRVDATASSVDGVSSAPIRCASRGPLETLIAARLRYRSGGLD